MLSIANRIQPGILLRQQNSRCSFDLCRYVSLDWNKKRSSINDRTVSQSISINQTRSFSVQAVSVGVIKTIANSSAVDHTQKLLMSIHDLTGLPWYAEIILASFILRTVLLSTVLYERHLSYVFETKLKNELRNKLDQLYETTKRKLQMRQLNSTANAKIYVNQQSRLIKKELYIKYNVHPFKRVICVLTPFPFWVIMSFSIAGLCSSARQEQFVEKESIIENMAFTKLETQLEGALWFKDLTLPDQYCVLSVLLLIAMFVSFEFSTHLQRHNWIENTRIRTFMFRLVKVFSVLLFFVSMSQPSGLALYWMTNSLAAFMQNVLLLNPKVKKLLRIRDTAYSLKRPGLSDFISHLRDRFINLKNKFVK